MKETLCLHTFIKRFLQIKGYIAANTCESFPYVNFFDQSSVYDLFRPLNILNSKQNNYAFIKKKRRPCVKG